MQTGNLQHEHKVCHDDTMDFRAYQVFDLDPELTDCQEREKDIYRKGHFPYSLLYNKYKEVEEKITDKDFYGNRLEEHFFSSDSNYLCNLKKSYHQFKLVEIASPEKVVIRL